jgi:hypothetical protein
LHSSATAIRKGRSTVGKSAGKSKGSKGSKGSKKRVLRPVPLEIVSEDEVTALVADNDREIAALEAELAAALEEANIAEARLLGRPAAQVLDDAFERAVIAAVERHVVEVETGRPVSAPTPRVEAPIAPPVAAPAPPVMERVEAPVAPPVETPEPPREQLPSLPRLEVPAPPATEPPSNGTSPARSRPRRTSGTTVVTRPSPGRPEPPAQSVVAAPAPAAPPVLPEPEIDLTKEPVGADVEGHADPTTLEPLMPDADAHEEFWDRPDEERSHRRLPRWPASLVIQAGIVLVIFALILFKLG